MSIEDYSNQEAPQGLQQFDKHCVLLFWDVVKQEWTPKRNFQPRSNAGTEGMRWFNYPMGCYYDGEKWWHDTYAENVSYHGDYDGDLQSNGYETGSISGKVGGKNVVVTSHTECLLVTEKQVGRWPYLTWKNNAGVMMAFSPFYQWRGARGFSS